MSELEAAFVVDRGFGDISDGNNVRVDSEHGHSSDDKVLKVNDGEANTKK